MATSSILDSSGYLHVSGVASLCQLPAQCGRWTIDAGQYESAPIPFPGVTDTSVILITSSGVTGSEDATAVRFWVNQTQNNGTFTVVANVLATDAVTGSWLIVKL